MKRLGSPPDASALEMGRRGRRYSRRQGAATARSLKSRRRQRRPGARARRRAAWERDPRATAELRFQPAPRDPYRRPVCGGPRAPRGCRHRQALSRARGRAPGHRLRGPANSPATLAAAARGRAAIPRSGRARRRHGDDQHRDLHPLLAPPGGLHARIATGELRHRLGFRGVSISDALETVSARDYGGPAKVGLAAARAGTDLLLYTDYRAAAKAGGALRTACGPGVCPAPGSSGPSSASSTCALGSGPASSRIHPPLAATSTAIACLELPTGVSTTEEGT